MSYFVNSLGSTQLIIVSAIAVIIMLLGLFDILIGKPVLSITAMCIAPAFLVTLIGVSGRNKLIRSSRIGRDMFCIFFPLAMLVSIILAILIGMIMCSLIAKNPEDAARFRMGMINAELFCTALFIAYYFYYFRAKTSNGFFNGLFGASCGVLIASSADIDYSELEMLSLRDTAGISAVAAVIAGVILFGISVFMYRHDLILANALMNTYEVKKARTAGNSK